MIVRPERKIGGDPGEPIVVCNPYPLVPVTKNGVYLVVRETGVIINDFFGVSGLRINEQHPSAKGTDSNQILLTQVPPTVTLRPRKDLSFTGISFIAPLSCTNNRLLSVPSKTERSVLSVEQNRKVNLPGNPILT